MGTPPKVLSEGPRLVLLYDFWFLIFCVCYDFLLHRTLRSKASTT
jgi:hypothetical protein